MFTLPPLYAEPGEGLFQIYDIKEPFAMPKDASLAIDLSSSAPETTVFPNKHSFVQGVKLTSYSLVMQNLPTAKSNASNVVYVENGFLKLS